MLYPDKEQLGNAIVELMGHLNAAGYRLLTLIAEMDERLDLCDGVKSTAHWLNWRCGISMPAAHEKVRVARALRGLPRTAAAFERGALSYSKVRAITRVATPYIEEDLLYIARYGTAAQLDRVVRGYRSATREEQRARRESRCFEHYLDEDGMLVVRGRFTPEDCAVVLAALQQAVQTLRADRAPEAAQRGGPIAGGAGATGGGNPTAGLDETAPAAHCAAAGEASVPAERGTDAVGVHRAMSDSPAEDFVERRTGDREEGRAASAVPDSPAEYSVEDRTGDRGEGRTDVQAQDRAAARSSDSPAEDGTDAASRNATVNTTRRADEAPELPCPRDWPFNPSGPERADAMALMARCFLAGGAPQRLRGEPVEVIVHVDWQALNGKGMAFYASGTGLAHDEVRRLTCEASLVTVVETAGGEPLSIGRKRRTVPTGMRRALESRDRCCRFPSCNQRRHLHAHHIQHWADGGETALDNLFLVCSVHHRLLHDGTFHVQRRPDGSLRFHRAGGEPMPDVVTQPVHAGMGPEGLKRLLARHGVEVRPGAADSEWMGDRLNLLYAVDGLFEADAQNRRKTASPT